MSTASCGPSSASIAAYCVAAFGTGIAVDRQALGEREEVGWEDAEAQPPACHRVRLAPTVEHNQAVAELRIVEPGGVLQAFIEDPRVDLVAEDDHVGPLLQTLDQALDLLSRL